MNQLEKLNQHASRLMEEMNSSQQPDKIGREQWIDKAYTELLKWCKAPETPEESKKIREWAETIYDANLEQYPGEYITPADAVEDEISASQ